MPKIEFKSEWGARGWVCRGLRIYKLSCNYDLRTLDGKKSKKMEKYRDFDKTNFRVLRSQAKNHWNNTKY